MGLTLVWPTFASVSSMPLPRRFSPQRPATAKTGPQKRETNEQKLRRLGSESSDDPHRERYAAHLLQLDAAKAEFQAYIMSLPDDESEEQTAKRLYLRERCFDIARNAFRPRVGDTEYEGSAWQRADQNRPRVGDTEYEGSSSHHSKKASQASLMRRAATLQPKRMHYSARKTLCSL